MFLAYSYLLNFLEKKKLNSNYPTTFVSYFSPCEEFHFFGFIAVDMFANNLLGYGNEMKASLDPPRVPRGEVTEAGV